MGTGQVKVAVVGPGAVGGAVAAYLSSAQGVDHFVCARTPVQQIALDTGLGHLFSTPRVYLQPRETDVVDWVIIATKAYDNGSAAAWLPYLADDRTLVAILQNGVDQTDRFSRYFDARRIVPAVVDLPVDRIAHGCLRQRRAGSLRVPDTVNGRDFCALFRGSSLDVRTVEDFLTASWRKLCTNCAGAATALAGSSDAVARDASAANLAALLASECAAVGRAEGAALGPETAAEVVRDLSRPNAGVNSLLADRLAGRPMEVRERNGVIVHKGAKHGIPTPANSYVVQALALISAPPDGVRSG